MQLDVSSTPATKRVIEISQESYLHLRHSLLVVEVGGERKISCPPEDLGYLLIDSPAVTISSGALRACAEAGVAVVVCDERHLPTAILTPLRGHTLASATLRGQVEAPNRTREDLWCCIVAAKIANQARLLDATGSPCRAIQRLAKSVEEGDPKNVEAQAARLYWPRLFGSAFRRDREAGGINLLLNYGYSVLRAAVARAICAAGLHPGLGLHHKNQYNPLCLADDVMEPLRPLVDARVRQLTSGSVSVELDRAAKSALLSLLNEAVRCNNQTKPLSVGLHEYMTSLREALLQKRANLEIPELWPSAV